MMLTMLLKNKMKMNKNRFNLNHATTMDVPVTTSIRILGWTPPLNLALRMVNLGDSHRRSHMIIER